MPNHIDNNVLIIANDELVKQIRDEIRGDEIDSNTGERVCIDFDKIVPMPKELEGTRSPSQIVTQEEYDKQEARFIELKALCKAINEKNDEDDKILQEMYFFSRSLTQELSDEYKAKFGYDNWYDWKVNNTGTKWGAYSCVGGSNSENNFFFQTAWEHPEMLMAKLSLKYPEATFVCTFADEDTGNNCGAIAYKKGISYFEDGGDDRLGEDFNTTFALCVQYGDDCLEQFDIEEDWYTKEQIESMTDIFNGGSDLINIARELNEKNSEFLTCRF